MESVFFHKVTFSKALCHSTLPTSTLFSLVHTMSIWAEIPVALGVRQLLFALHSNGSSFSSSPSYLQQQWSPEEGRSWIKFILDQGFLTTSVARSSSQFMVAYVCLYVCKGGVLVCTCIWETLEGNASKVLVISEEWIKSSLTGNSCNSCKATQRKSRPEQQNKAQWN